jgi:hypothetical protein
MSDWPSSERDSFRELVVSARLAPPEELLRFVLFLPPLSLFALAFFAIESISFARSTPTTRECILDGAQVSTRRRTGPAYSWIFGSVLSRARRRSAVAPPRLAQASRGCTKEHRSNESFGDQTPDHGSLLNR